MAQYELEGLFHATLNGLKDMIDSNTVVGKPVETADGTTIIPISRVSFGYGMGGWNYDERQTAETDKKAGITGGSGGGVSVAPVGFLVVSGGEVQLLHVDSSTPLEKICDTLPSVVQAIADLFKKD